MKSSGAVYGAWNDRNDPYNKERDRHAQEFYESVRNRNKQHEIVKVSKNSRLSQSDVEKIYNHVFINEYDLEDGRKRFDPSYDMAGELATTFRNRWQEYSTSRPCDVTP